MIFLCQIFVYQEKIYKFAPQKITQTHGVAVTLLILVQSSGVRIPVGLQATHFKSGFCFSIIDQNFWITNVTYPSNSHTLS